MVPVNGNIYYADLPYDGHLQGGRRPVVVVQNHKGNVHGPTVHVVPLTGQIKKLHMETHVVLKPSKKNGLKKASMTLAESLRPISKELIQEPIGALSPEEKEMVNKAVRAHLAI